MFCWIPARILPKLHPRIGAREFDAVTRFHDGPSRTADIEGILIHGAQGIRTLTIVPIAARPE